MSHSFSLKQKKKDIFIRIIIIEINSAKKHELKRQCWLYNIDSFRLNYEFIAP